MKRIFIPTGFLAGILLTCFLHVLPVQAQQKMRDERYRPQYHFTPEKNWNNDPNGLVYYKGEYHLFYQYYPGGMAWGPMHWGHAVSKDMLHWKNLPVALYPDSIGYIFSGSAVVDEHNTAGFQRGKEKTLVAIFTYHDPKDNEESQAIAYSNDKGRTWRKYKGNPVIANPGLKDFRDPKVRWFDPLKKWIMVVSCHDHVSFYSSSDLKNWTKESEFGKDNGSHGGVWECPDLFPLRVKGSGQVKWILTVNNGGAPAGGGGTQYFIGEFNGHAFTPNDDKVRWLYGGADEYAGITWNRTRNRTIFVGWMNNWPEANPQVPSYIWRGGMTLPVELTLGQADDGEWHLIKKPIEELRKQEKSLWSGSRLRMQQGPWMKNFDDAVLSSSKITLEDNDPQTSLLTLSLQNDLGEHIDIIYDRKQRRLIVDRTHADADDFHAASARRHTLEIPDGLSGINMTIYYDRSTIEVFFDGGKYAIADLVFPAKWYNAIRIQKTGGNDQIEKLDVNAIRSVW